MRPKTIAVRFPTAAVISAPIWLGAIQGAEAGVNTWTTNRPEGGDIFALAVDPQTPTTVYAGISGGGVFALQKDPAVDPAQDADPVSVPLRR